MSQMPAQVDYVSPASNKLVTKLQARKREAVLALVYVVAFVVAVIILAN